MSQDIYTGKKILVTGASSGIGAEFAKILSNFSCILILAARRADVLEALKAELLKAGKAEIYPIQADLSTIDGIENFYLNLQNKNLIPDILINNAGMVTYGYFHQQDLQKESQQIILNCVAPVYLIHKILPSMLKNNFGRILNVGSVAGNMPAPFFAIYNATKAFINSFSQSLSGELRGKNIQCDCLLPGRTKSELYNKSELLKLKVGTMEGFAKPERVAAYGLKLLEEGKDFGIFGWQNKLKQLIIKRLMPRRILLRLLHRHCYRKELK